MGLAAMAHGMAPVILVGTAVGAGVFERAATRVDPRLWGMDREMAGLEFELASLPDWRPYGQTLRLGYQSLSARGAAPRWVQLDLGAVRQVDRVVVVPVQMASARQLGVFGMPIRFRVEVSEVPGFGAGAWSAEFPPEGKDYPEGFPAMMDCGGRRARYVRLTALKLWRAAETELLAVGEMMVISGNRNVAVGLPAGALSASDSLEQLPTWSLENLVDGHSSLGAPVWRQSGDSMGGIVRPAKAGGPAWVQIDFGREVSLDELRVVPIQPDALKAAVGPGIGLPGRIEFEAATDAGALRWVALAIPDHLFSVNPGRCPLVVPLGGQSARHLRLRHRGPRGGSMAMAMAEIQAYSGDTNVAPGSGVGASDSLEEPPMWGAAQLVDGEAYGRRIVEWPEFLDGILRKGELLARLETLRDERAALVAEAVIMMRGLGLGAVLLSFVGAGVVVRMLKERRRQLAAMRDRILRDMHDEVGSGLGAIGLLSQFAHEGTGDVRADMAEIHRLSQELNESLRDLVWLSGTEEETVGDLGRRLARTAAAVLPGIDTRVEVRGEGVARKLSMQARRELMLFAKEALHNAGTHAGARQVTIALEAGARRLRLEVRDDGMGFDADTTRAGTGLRGMRARAASLGGRLEIESAPGKGTRVAMELPSPKKRA